MSSADIPKTVTFNSLAKRALKDTPDTGAGERKFWEEDNGASTALNWTVHKGWYLDLAETSERLLKPVGFYDASNILSVFTQVPAKGTNDLAAAAKESCTFTLVDKERQYLTLVNIMDGKRPSIPVFDKDGNGTFTGPGPKVELKPGSQTLVDKSDGIMPSNDRELSLAFMPEISLRPTWRQLR